MVYVVQQIIGESRQDVSRHEDRQEAEAVAQGVRDRGGRAVVVEDPGEEGDEHGQSEK